MSASNDVASQLVRNSSTAGQPHSNVVVQLRVEDDALVLELEEGNEQHLLLVFIDPLARIDDFSLKHVIEAGVNEVRTHQSALGLAFLLCVAFQIVQLPFDAADYYDDVSILLIVFNSILDDVEEDEFIEVPVGNDHLILEILLDQIQIEPTVLDLELEREDHLPDYVEQTLLR
eukprot:CAMPEP_0170510984 /NCGR_PEP_ID=MMETSP0208-20121228/66057_1 /TAXON_ID=197538 /ORGANISM="Strombidium inclinatum, Strain S3" /LENGTH=173 /DNA_ID=CAMNT_0010794485 /DNA_START=2743 /DNA_END=3261 /DNA_ORIENTATION=+